MKRFCFLLFLFFTVSLSFCTSYGSSRLEVTREWNITGQARDVNFTGMLALNNSNQHVVEIIADAPLKVRTDGEKVLVEYDGPFNGSMIYHARAIVEINYDTHITKDEPVLLISRQGTDFTAFDDSIKQTADGLVVQDSSLKTLEAVSQWIGDNMTYDLSYFGLVHSAKQVIRDRRGVCVEYTHLFMSMANALGFENRYVGGYAMADDWQAHSWAQVYLDGKWVDFDPTFKEAGILDNNHFAMSYGQDANDIYDKATSYGDVSISTKTSLKSLNEQQDAKGGSVAVVFDKAASTANITVSNTRDDYVFGSYQLVVPPEYGGETHRIILLQPNSQYKDSKVFPASSFQEGYTYTIPIKVSFNDANTLENIVISPGAAQPPIGNPAGCNSAFALLLLIGGGFLAGNRVQDIL